MQAGLLAHSLRLIFVGACALCTGAAFAGELKVALSGAEVVPPVQTAATADAVLMVDADKSVHAKVTLKNITPFAAHIHQGEAGTNGPPVIFLEKKADGSWGEVAGAKLSDEQYASYLAGKLYFQFHTEKYRPGEIRGQIKP
ncbi:MAG: CHRD domain-containing protein [Pseudomonadota bacterium]